MWTLAKLALLGLAHAQTDPVTDDQCVLWIETFTTKTDCTGTKSDNLVNMTVGKCWKISGSTSMKITECSEAKIKYDYHSSKGDCNGGTVSTLQTQPKRIGINHENKADTCISYQPFGSTASVAYTMINSPTMNNAQAATNKASIATLTTTQGTLATKTALATTNTQATTNKNDIAGVKTSLTNYATVTNFNALDATVKSHTTTIAAQGTKIDTVTTKANGLGTDSAAQEKRIAALETKVTALETKATSVGGKVTALELARGKLTEELAAVKKIAESKASWCLMFICW